MANTKGTRVIKGVHGTQMKNPSDSLQDRQELLKQIDASNLPQDAKDKLSADIRNDDLQQFILDGGIEVQLDQLS